MSGRIERRRVVQWIIRIELKESRKVERRREVEHYDKVKKREYKDRK